MSAEPVTLDQFIRPSALTAIAGCPGRPSMEAAMVNRYGTPVTAAVAALGTSAHGWGEAGIRLLTIDPETMAPYEALPDIDSVLAAMRLAMGAEEPVRQLDSWSTWCVEFYVRAVHDLAVKHSVAPCDILVEHHLTMDGLGFRQGGTSDCILVVPFKKVVVVDFKAGFLDQDDASEHDQLAAYAYGAAKDFSVDQVEVWIVAPRCDRDRRITGGAFDAEALRTTGVWIEAITRRARGPDPELVPSYVSCLYCKALTRCKPAKDWIMNVNEALTLIGDPQDADEWGRLADARAIAARFEDDAKGLLKVRLKAGQPVTGWKLGAGRAMFKISSVHKAIDLLDEKGFTEQCSAALTLKVGELSQEAREVLTGAQLAEEVPSEPSLKPVKGAKASAA